MFDVFRKDLTVYRTGEGKYINGLWEDGATSSFTIKASIQATDAEIMQTLPEGERTKESYTLFTGNSLKTSEVNKSKPDVVIIEGERYQVIRVTAHQNLKYPTAHYEVLVTKENIDAN
jgi:hypothetical protein